MTELKNVVLNQVEYKEYVFSKGQDDRERLFVLFRGFRPSFVEQINKVLDEYGLAARLKEATPERKLKILDLGCGEGLALQAVAEILEQRGLLQNADLFGIDSNRVAIATAEQFKLLCVPPRPYLHFLVHDATTPLSKCLGLFFDFPDDELKNGEPQFDFIFSSMVFEHISNARSHLERLYQKSLKPGGIVYIRDAVTEEGKDGWISPHPAMQPFLSAIVKYMAAANPGIDVAVSTEAWLGDFGAMDIQAVSTLIPIGGTTEIGLNMLRGMFMGIRNAEPLLIDKGMVTKEQYEVSMKQLFKELGPNYEGRNFLKDTIARKPD